MFKTLLERVQSHSDFILKKPLKMQLVSYLSENFCPKGEIAGVNAISLRAGNQAVCEYSEGFVNESVFLGFKINIEVKTPVTDAMRHLKIISESWESLIERYRDITLPTYIGQEFKWGIIIPAGLRNSYLIAILYDPRDIPGFNEYVSCLKSLLTFYEESQQDSVTGILMRNIPHVPEILTERQEVIVGKIRDGKTNAVIAHDLGYSESLIRKETIIIYRKLGVAGRQELL